MIIKHRDSPIISVKISFPVFLFQSISRHRASSVLSILPLRSSPSFLFGPLHQPSPFVLFGSRHQSFSVLAISPFRSSPSGLFGPGNQPSSVLTTGPLLSSPSALFGPRHRFTTNINWSQNRASIISWIESHASNNNAKAIPLAS